ncbi:type IX secretion system membrane protein PorP/SprF [Aurantibacter crassamenti]|uniref:PorP/SprF family type IX secretion system membrane protein n=1 Tax=Aurantibacter crassamenti TaxID=1837375 RepID=UPI001939736F|nr:type IX secretion system membrane protein PorP/SprF [Aurantibacter crassamenti]MBM1107700.1 type IX secretion system membrane protein PorP/SprF [Aurantibacter crassamenti]
MNIKFKHIRRIYFILAFVACYYGNAQQEPQYTQYQYNTMSVNPAYAGSQGYASIIAVYRNQWVNIQGSPRTISLGVDTPFKLFSGLGLSIARDELGPSDETYFNANYSHSLILNRKGHRLAFGLKGGGKYLSVDWSKGTFKDPDTAFQENITGKFLPSVGAGIYFYTDNAYLGLSTPNVLQGQRYDDIQETVDTDRIHLYFIGGYVFELNPSLSFKPSTFVKYVNGAPLIFDVSANFLINKSIHLGASYRWDDSVSALLGFNISPNIQVGYSYDYNITNLTNYNAGSHEIFIKYNFISRLTKIRSPRFF